MSDYIGPQQASPFDNLSDEQRSHLDKALAIANGVQLYKSAGGVGVGAQWKPYAEQLAKRGGLSEQEALLLAKYKMWKGGAPVVPETRMPALTPEQIAARRDQFIAGDPATRGRLMDEDKAAIYNSELGHFDGLVEKKKPEPKPEAESKPVSAATPDKAKQVST